MLETAVSSGVGLTISIGNGFLLGSLAELAEGLGGVKRAFEVALECLEREAAEIGSAGARPVFDDESGDGGLEDARGGGE